MITFVNVDISHGFCYNYSYDNNVMRWEIFFVATNAKTNSVKRKRTTTNTKKRQSTQKKKKQGLQSEVILLLIIAVSIILFLSCFGLCGKFGDICNYITFGLFGAIGYLIPFVLVGMSATILFIPSNFRRNIKLFGVCLILLAICTFAHLLSYRHFDPQITLEAYLKASLNGRSGGWFGALIYKPLCMAMDIIGTYVVTFFLLLIGVIILTEKSIIRFFKNLYTNTNSYGQVEEDERFVTLQKEREALRQEKLKARKEEQIIRQKEHELRKISGIEKKIDKRNERIEEQRIERMKKAAQPVSGITLDLLTKTIGVDEDKKKSTTKISTKKPQRKNHDDDHQLIDDIIITDYRDREFEKEDDVFANRQPIATTNFDDIDNLVDISEDENAQYNDERFFDREEPSKSPVFPVEYQDMTKITPSSEIDSFESLPLEENLALKGLQRAGQADHTIDSDGVRTVVTSSGKVIQYEVEGIPGTKKVVAASRDSDPHGIGEKRTDLDDDKIKINTYTPKKEHIFPSINLLNKPVRTGNEKSNKRELNETAAKLQQTLLDFGVGVTITNVSCGPSVTRYELQPEQGVKVSRILALADDIKLNLAAADIRIEAPIPGKAAVGIEVPNKENTPVLLRSIIESPEFRQSKSNISFAVGKDISGQTIVTDIGKMPHLLIAGATGSGKSVCINTLITSILYKAKPEDVKLIMIDPKVVELSIYNGIPHLMLPVVTDPKKATNALGWAVNEMTDRYQKFAEHNVRDIGGYNAKIETLLADNEENKLEKMPQIVIVVDELADLMMVAPKDVEESICRLAQLARAAGIHLVIATQRPSVNVITGLIKANMPSRIAFAVSSGVDSRTIIDGVGAEKLLGKGDMLFYPYGYPKPVRIQGAFVSDKEVTDIVAFLSKQTKEEGGQMRLNEDVITAPLPSEKTTKSDEMNQNDELFFEAGECIIMSQKASIGMLQRRFRIGFNRAARIVDQLALAGVVGEEEGTKPRKILMSEEEYREKFKA